MAYTTVYCPEGKKYEVASRDRASNLILLKGWTQQPVTKEVKPKKKPYRRKEKTAFISAVPADPYISKTDSGDES